MLNESTKEALNHTFIVNVKSNQNRGMVSVADAVKEFYGKDTQTKHRIINRILP